MRLFILMGLCLSLLAGCGSEDRPEAAEVPASGPEAGLEAGATPLSRPAPDFSLATLDGGTFRLADHLGEVVLINFWATWCGPCVFETPELVELYNDLHEDGLTIVGISLDEEGFELVEEFAERFEVSYPLVVDDGDVAAQYGGILALPTTFVVDKTGQITARYIGLFPTDDMRSEIEQMLRDKPGISAR